MKIELSPRGFLNVCFHQLRKILLIFLFFLCIGTWSIALSERLYESNGSLLVKFGHDASPDISRAGDKNEEVSQNDRREIMESDAEILQSHDLMEMVIKEVGVDTLYPGLSGKVAGIDAPDEVAIRKLLSGDLNVKVGQQSDLISVSLMNRSPQVAARFLHILFEVFIARQSDVYNNPHSKFLSDQVKNANAQLENSQRKLEEFKQQEGISSIDDEMTELLKEKSDADTIVFQAVNDAQASISALEAKKEQLLVTYQASSPQVIQVQKSIDVAKRQLREQQSDLKGHAVITGAEEGTATILPGVPFHAATPAPAKNIGVLSARLQAINARIAKLETLRGKYNDLLRQVQIDEQNYKNIQVSGEEAKINDTLNQKNITRISIVDDPVVTMKPVRPRKMLIMAISIVAGLLCGFTAAFIAETLDDRFSTPEQVALVLRIPVMASFAATRRT